MSALLPSLAVLLACATCAAPAAAETGNGLYEPFPSGVSKVRAKRFFKRLPPQARELVGPVSERVLEHGLFVASTRGVVTPAPGAASARAGAVTPAPGTASARAGGAPGPDSSLGWPLQLVLVLVPLAGGVAVAARRS
jgi:hypothetical protein